MVEQREVSAKTVDEAIELALKEMGAKPEEVEIEVLSKGKAGFLGFGGEPARVRVKRIPPKDASVTGPIEVVNKLLALTGVSAAAALRNANDPEVGGPVIDIQGEDSGLLIGRRGETLRAFQFMVNVLVNAKRTEQVRVYLDVEQYRGRRQQALQQLAQKVADRVATTGRAITLEPMTAAERRVIHLTLANHPSVSTYSVDAGLARKVTVAPKRAGSQPRHGGSNDGKNNAT